MMLIYLSDYFLVNYENYYLNQIMIQILLISISIIHSKIYS